MLLRAVSRGHYAVHTTISSNHPRDSTYSLVSLQHCTVLHCTIFSTQYSIEQCCILSYTAVCGSLMQCSTILCLINHAYCIVVVSPPPPGHVLHLTTHYSVGLYQAKNKNSQFSGTRHYAERQYSTQNVSPHKYYFRFFYSLPKRGVFVYLKKEMRESVVSLLQYALLFS